MDAAAPTARRRVPAADAALGLAAVVFLGLAAYFAQAPYPTRVDLAAGGLVASVDARGGTRFGDTASEVAVEFAALAVADAALVIAAYRYGSAPVAGVVAASVLGLEVILRAAKALVGRPRPEGAYATSGSYPSGHVAHVALAVLLLLVVVLPLLRRRRGLQSVARRDAALAAALAALFAGYRLLSGEHWLTDVLGGAALATAWALATARVVQRWLPPADRP